MDKFEEATPKANKTPMKVCKYSVCILAILLMGSCIVANVLVYNYLFQKVDRVSTFTVFRSLELRLSSSDSLMSKSQLHQKLFHYRNKYPVNTVWYVQQFAV